MTTPIKIPQVNALDYEITEDLWTSLTTEVTTVLERIDRNDDLSPEDVKSVKQLANQVDDYVTKYNRQLTTSMQKYKENAKRQLQLIGYDRIEAYISTKRKEQTNQQNARMNAKIQQFKTLVNQSLTTAPLTSQTVLVDSIIPLLMGRFPKINSGAVSKEISNWKPIELVVSKSIQTVETFFSENPVLVSLPLYSHTMQQLSSYLKTGNLESLSNIKESMTQDTTLLRQMILRQKITSKQSAVDMIQQAVTSESSAEDILAYVSEIITITNTI